MVAAVAFMDTRFHLGHHAFPLSWESGCGIHNQRPSLPAPPTPSLQPSVSCLSPMVTVATAPIAESTTLPRDGGTTAGRHPMYGIWS